MNTKTDPISLTILSATGHEHKALEHDNIVEVAILEQPQSAGPGTDGFRDKYGEDPYPQSQNDKSFIAGDGTKK